MVVLRRLDCVLEPTKDAVLKKRDQLEAQQMPETAMDRLLGKAADPDRKHPLYNTSPYTFARLLGDAERIAPNLVSYINGLSPIARHIFERFKFADHIEKLDASNRLFIIVKAMAAVDLHPDRIDNLQMGYLFEHLVMRFNERANEEAGDHFTPREVIRLMANPVYTGERDVYTPGIYRRIYDPACGTGGMLSVSQELILGQNERAELDLFGQEYNDESWAICCSDMLIKDEDTANIVLGDTLGDGKTGDGGGAADGVPGLRGGPGHAEVPLPGGRVRAGVRGAAGGVPARRRLEGRGLRAGGARRPRHARPEDVHADAVGQPVVEAGMRAARWSGSTHGSTTASGSSATSCAGGRRWSRGWVWRWRRSAAPLRGGSIARPRVAGACGPRKCEPFSLGEPKSVPEGRPRPS